MTMLSRVADRLFWMACYLERAEDVARLAAAYNHLIMDIPKGSEPEWAVPIRILDAEDSYRTYHRAFNELSVCRFLIANEQNPSSIHYSIRAARENVRTTRDVLPEEAWEYINELYLYSQEMAEKSIGRRHRFEYLERVITGCQMINGLVLTTLPRGHSYRFIKLGSLLERADMTTRIIDVGAAAILGQEAADPAVESLLWGNLLKSLSAMGAYRLHIGPSVEANAVIDFVFKEPTLPRSALFCLNGIREELKPLKNNGPALRLVDHLRRRLKRFNAIDLSLAQVHEFIDNFQLLLIKLNRNISDTWCRTEPQ